MRDESVHYFTERGSSVTLAEELRKGLVHASFLVAEPSRSVATIYHAPPSAWTTAKLRAMIAHPPIPARSDAIFPTLAWPKSLLVDGDGTVCGYLMPVVEPVWRLEELFDTEQRAQLRTFSGQPVGWHHLHDIARNLARVVAACHSAGYVVGDLGERNVRVYPNGQVALIDCDAFQVGAQINGEQWFYPSNPVFSDTAGPELADIDPETTELLQESDDFALAVLVYRLLQEGTHPFAANPKNDLPLDPMQLTEASIFPYTLGARAAGVEPRPEAPSFGRLEAALRSAFLAAFTTGLITPDARPPAKQWEKTLTVARTRLVRCSRGHFYSANGAGRCLHVIPVQGGSYCGAAMGAPAPTSLPLTQVDQITGAVRTEVSPPTPLMSWLPSSWQNGASSVQVAARGVTGVYGAIVSLCRWILGSFRSEWKAWIPVTIFVIGLIFVKQTDTAGPSRNSPPQQSAMDRVNNVVLGLQTLPTEQTSPTKPKPPTTIGPHALRMLHAASGPGALFYSTRSDEIWSLSARDLGSEQTVTLLYSTTVDPMPVLSHDRSQLAYFSTYDETLAVSVVSLVDGSISYLPIDGIDRSPVGLAWSADDVAVDVSFEPLAGLPLVRSVALTTGAESGISNAPLDPWSNRAASTEAGETIAGTCGPLACSIVQQDGEKDPRTLLTLQSIDDIGAVALLSGT